MSELYKLAANLTGGVGGASAGEIGGTSAPLEAPSQELVKAFEAALEGEAADAGAVQAGNSVVGHDPTSGESPQIADFDPMARKEGLFAEGVYSSGTRPEQNSPHDAAIGQKTHLEVELSRLVDKIGSGNAAPEELFRLQYLTGVLRAQGTAGQQVSHKIGEDFEMVLKQH